jgi:GDP-L-fucose synthase
MKKKSKIYIAGHQGLVGSAFIRLLQKNGYQNLITKSFQELDLRNQQEVETFFKKEQPDYVFLAAAKVGGIHANNTYKAEFLYDNIMIATNVINAAYKSGVKKLLNLGSSCIYPKMAPQPLKEDYLLTGPLEPTNESYAIAKISAIKMCQFYNEQYGTNFMSVMPTNLYGPNDNFHLENAHVLPTLLRKFHLAKLLEQNDFESIKQDITQNPISTKKITFKSETEIVTTLKNLGITKDSVEIWGTGKPYREFLYVDDLAHACIFLMQKNNAKDITPFINIGTEQDIQIKDLANIIKNITGFTGNIIFESNKPDGTPRKLLDVSKIHTLGWQHTIDLKNGIQNVYSWYTDNIMIQNINNFQKKESQDVTR